MDKPSVCRVARVKGWGDILMGRDFRGIFKEGHVYDIREILGAHVITDLGHHAEYDRMQDRIISSVIATGVPLYTVDEYREIKGLEAQNG